MGWVIILPKTVGVALLRKGRVSRDLEELGELIMLISKGNVFQAEGIAGAKALSEESWSQSDETVRSSQSPLTALPPGACADAVGPLSAWEGQSGLRLNLHFKRARNL